MGDHTDLGHFSRKFGFSFITMLVIILAVVFIRLLDFPEKVAIVAILATELPILVVAVSYLTGQAKIDVQALYGRPASENAVMRGPPPPKESSDG